MIPHGALAFVVLLSGLLASPQAPVEVQPGDLANRRDLVGKPVVVDDRVVLFFQVPPKGYGQIWLKRSTVPVVLPQALYYDSLPRAKAARVKGVLRVEDGKMVLDATEAPELFKSDLDRLRNVVATLTPGDSDARYAWGDWASHRGTDFGDDDLKGEAARLIAEAVAIEAAKPGSRSPDGLLALARKARSKGVAEPEPSALAHLGLRVRLGTAKTLEDFQKVADEASAILPGAKTPAKPGVALPLEEFAKDPSGVYRRSGIYVREGLDRRAWTDAVAETYRLRSAAGDPRSLLTLSNEARDRLPDRLEVSGELRRRYYQFTADNVATLRENEMLDLARTMRDDLKQPEKSVAVTRAWLDHQRAHSLGANDAEQRIELAKKYRAYVKDQSAAADLMREALKIDPANRSAADEFQRMGYVKVNGSWSSPNEAASRPTIPAVDEPAKVGKDDPFLGLTPAEVKGQLGEPRSVSRVATQGRVSMQWVYEGARGSQYIDFVQRLGDPQPLVVGRFSLK